MSNFSVSKWFADRASLKIQKFEIEGIEFELMALNESLIDDVELCDSYDDMILLAADSGISYDRNRVVDDEGLKKDLDKLWSLDSLDINCDPCIKYRVGEKVCEISGLSSTLEDMLKAQKEAEEAVNNIDGDNLPDGDVTLGQLQDDANAALQP